MKAWVFWRWLSPLWWAYLCEDRHCWLRLRRHRWTYWRWAAGTGPRFWRHCTRCHATSWQA